ADKPAVNRGVIPDQYGDDRPECPPLPVEEPPEHAAPDAPGDAGGPAVYRVGSGHGGLTDGLLHDRSFLLHQTGLARGHARMAHGMAGDIFPALRADRLVARDAGGGGG